MTCELAHVTGVVLLQELGYQGEIGYQTFLYSSVKEWRKLLMFLLEKLPREAVQAADEPTGWVCVSVCVSC